MKKPIPVSATVVTYQIVPCGAVGEASVNQCGLRASSVVNIRAGDPKKCPGSAMPTKRTLIRISASLTTLAQAVPRSPAVKTKRAVNPNPMATAAVGTMRP